MLFSVHKWLIMVLPLVLVIVYAVQKVYLRSLRQLQALELESKAVVVSGFLESVSCHLSSSYLLDTRQDASIIYKLS
jgi:hypothetical protein